MSYLLSDVRFPGLVTGIDTNKIVAQLMAVERRTLNMYTERQTLWQEKKDALNTIETKLSSLRSSLRALSDADELRTFSVSSSDKDILTADASYNAFEGTHTVVINQLATAERSVHTTGIEYPEDLVGEGTFIYSYNHKETIIQTTATTTLEDFVGLINNDANNPGVTASLLQYDDAYHLVLNGNEGGTDYKISINVSNTDVWKSDSELTYNNDNATLSTKIRELDQFIGTPHSADKITINGTDRNGVALTLVELNVTADTKIAHLINKINDAFDGIAKATFVDGKIVLTDNTCDTSSLFVSLALVPGDDASLDLSMSESTEGGTTDADLADFTVSDFAETQTAQDSKIKVNGWPTTSAVAEEQKLHPTEVVAGGAYTLTFDGQTTAEIAYDAGKTAIENALNALDSIAAIGDVTVTCGVEGLKDGDVTFTFASTAGDVDMIAFKAGTGLNPPELSKYVMTEETKGHDGYINRSSNTVDDVIHGVTLYLHDTTEAAGEQITLTRDTASVKEKLNAMVTAYNLAVTYIKEKTDYDEATGTAGVLMGDYIISAIRSQIRTPLISHASGFVDDVDTFLTPAQIGLELDRDGVLSLNTNVFDEAIAEGSKGYLHTLALIGADKTGSSTSDVVEFYGASSRYTTAGEYDVEVVVSGGEITTARIKLSTESSYRNMTIIGTNIIMGISTFDSNGDPVYPENGLQLSVDVSQDGDYTGDNSITVRVKQGFTGAIEDVMDRALKIVSGSIQISQDAADDSLDEIEDRIDDEKDRLEKKEARLVGQFAKLESTLALLQSQMAGLFGL